MTFATIDTPIGWFRITENNGFVIEVREVDDGIASPDCKKNLDDVIAQIKDYFSGALHQFSFPVELYGTPFQKAVWMECRKIPYGETRTYSDIAHAIGCPGAVRAVGTALGKNPILLAVPCHRVMARKGMGGFRLGQNVKSYLLGLEGKVD